MKHNLYNTRIICAQRAGFNIYCDTISDDGVFGTTLTNTNPSSKYNGECIDIFENDTYEHYSQFKEQELKFKLATVN